MNIKGILENRKTNYLITTNDGIIINSIEEFDFSIERLKFTNIKLSFIDQIKINNYKYYDFKNKTVKKIEITNENERLKAAAFLKNLTLSILKLDDDFYKVNIN